MRLIRTCGMMLCAAVAGAGCSMMKSSDNATGTSTASPAPMAMTVPPIKDATHVLTKDSAFYKSNPTDKAAPAGMWKQGTKVIVIAPRGGYVLVRAGDNTEAYVSLDDLKPL